MMNDRSFGRQHVLLDVMTEGPSWLSWSAEAIERAADSYRLVINPVIFAEVSIRYSQIEELDASLPKNMFDREAVPYAAALLAVKSSLAFRRRGGTKPIAIARLFHRRARGRRGISADDARPGAPSHLLSHAVADRSRLSCRLVGD